jgi:Bacterial export proteins, family 1.
MRDFQNSLPMISLDLNSLLTLFLIHVRVISFLLMVPFFGRELLPNTFKAFFATALSFMLFLYTDQKPIEFATTGHFFLAVLKEFLENVNFWHS